MKKEKRAVIIDTDLGIDDAVALAIALNHPALDIRLLTTVAGNVNVNKTTENTLKLVSFFQKQVPVAKGCDKPLLIQLEDSVEVHGESGMDGYDFPASTKKVLAVHAVEAMKDTILQSQEAISLVPIAALTNIGILLSLYPEVKKNIKEIVMMGGSLSRGNTTTSSEFNTYADPHAAQIVFQSGIPIVMIGLDVTSIAVLTKNETTKIKELGKVGKMFYSLFQHYRGGSLQTGLKMHDVCAIAYLTDPQLFTVQETFIEVALDGPAAGCTVADLKMKYHETTNAVACLDIDVPQFQKWVVSNLEKIN